MAKFLDDAGLKTLVNLLKGYVDDSIDSLDLNIFVFVDALPSTGEEGKIYFVPDDNDEDDNNFVEWIWKDSKWEKLGEAKVDVDLSGYVNSVSASGTNLTLSASISGNTLTITGSVATATSSTLGLVKVTDGNGLSLSSGTVSMAAATTSAAGAMSSSDKSKLDSLEEMTPITTAEIEAMF